MPPRRWQRFACEGLRPESSCDDSDVDVPPLYFQTSLGLCALGWGTKGVTFFRFLGEGRLPKDEAKLAPIWVLEAARAITRYLAGDLHDLKHIPLDPSVLTPFQRKVAEALHSTHPGQTLTYGELALMAGSAGAARAVGRAVKANPILLLIPCHRVVAGKGPGGWSAFGSLEIKARLLELEKAHT